MKTDRLLLVAIVAVMAAVVGYLFFSDDTQAGERRDTSGAALSANAGAGGGPRQTLGGEPTETFVLPAGFSGRSPEDVAEFFGRKRSESYQFSLANTAAGPIRAGQAVNVPTTWLAAYQQRLKQESPGLAGNTGTGESNGPGQGPSEQGPSEIDGPDVADKSKPEQRVPPEKGLRDVTPPQTQPRQLADNGSPSAANTEAPWASFLHKVPREQDAPRNRPAAPSTGTRPLVPVRNSSDPVRLSTKPTSGFAYEARQGDTLWKIAETVYGKGTLYTDIVSANQALVGSDGSKLRAGMVIFIP